MSLRRWAGQAPHAVRARLLRRLTLPPTTPFRPMWHATRWDYAWTANTSGPAPRPETQRTTRVSLHSPLSAALARGTALRLRRGLAAPGPADQVHAGNAAPAN